MLIRTLTYVVTILLSSSLGGCSFEGDAATQPKAADERVRELITIGQVDELDKFLNSVQFAFESGNVKENIPFAAFAPFATTDPAVDRLARAWLRSHPDSFAACLAAAIQSEYMGRVSAKAGALADSTGQEPQSPSQYFATAARYYMLAITLEPRALPAYTGLISVYTESGQKTALREANNLALKRFPLSPHIHKQVLVGLTPEYEGSWDKMLTYVQGVGDRTQPGVQPGSKVNRLYDELFHTLELYRARSLFDQKIYQQARIVANQRIKVQPSTDFLHLRAEIHTAQENINDALADLDRILVFSPYDSWAHFRKAALLSEIGMLPIAEPHWRQAIKLDPYHPEILRVHAQALAEAGRQEAALSNLKKALMFGDHDHDLHSKIAELLSQAGAMPDAIRHLEIARDLRPDLSGYRRRLSALRFAVVQQNGMARLSDEPNG